MSRGFWITLIVIIVFLAVAIVAATPRLVRYYISEYQVVQKLEQATKRRVRVDSVEISLWQGLRLNRVEISEFPGWEKGVWIRADLVSLQPRLWPLLWGRIKVNKIRVEGFEMTFRHGTRGGWNVSRGFQYSDGDTETTPTSSPTTSQSTMAFSPQTIELVQGELHIQDEVVDRSLSLQFQQVTLSEFDPSRGGTLEVENLILPEGNLLGTARVQFNPFVLTLQNSRINFVELKPFLPFLRQYGDVSLPVENVTLNARIEQGQWDTGGAWGEGRLELSGLELGPGRSDSPPIRRAAMGGRIEWGREASRVRFDVKEPRINRYRLAQQVRGTVHSPWDRPRVQTRIDLTGVKVNRLSSFMREWGVATVPENLKIDGTFSGSKLVVKGQWPSLDWSGSMSFERLDVAHQNLPSPVGLRNLKLRFDGTDMKIERGTLATPDQSLAVQGTVEQYRSFPSSRLDLSIRGQQLKIGPFLSYLRETGFASLPDLRAEGNLEQLRVRLSGPVSRPEWDVSGRVAGAQFQTTLLPESLMDLNGDVHVTPHKLEWTGLSGTYSDRRFNVGGWITLPVSSASDFKINGSMESIQGETILSFLPGDVVPEGLSLKGPLTIRDAAVEGPLSALSWSANVIPRKVRITLPPVPQPLSEVQGTVQTSGRYKTPEDTQASLMSGLVMKHSGTLEGMFRNRPFRLSGTLPLPLEPATEFTLRVTIARLPLDSFSALFPKPLFGKHLSVSGPVTIRDGVVEGPMNQISWRGRVSLEGVVIRSPNLPAPLRNVKGNLQIREVQDTAPRATDAAPSSRMEMDIEGSYQNRPFMARGGCRLPFGDRQPFHLKLSVQHIPVEAVLEAFPHQVVPDQLGLEGPVTVRNVDIRGPLADLSWEGDLVAEGMSFRTPFLNEPLQDIKGSIVLNRSRAHFDQTTARLGDYQLRLRGDLFRKPNHWVPGITIDADTIPVSFLLSRLRDMPTFPEGWEPGGEVNIRAALTGTLDSPRVEGTLRASILSLGEVVGTNARSNFTYHDGRFKADTITMKVFDGELEGLVTIGVMGSPPELNMRTNLSRLGLAEMLNSLTGMGGDSDGRLTGSVDLSGPAGDFAHFSGPVDLKGTDLTFEDIPAMQRLSFILNTNLTRVLETGLGGAILNILTLDFSRSTEKLKSMFTSDITTRFREGRLAVTFDRGKGSIRELKLTNKELTIEGTGTIWLDGRIDMILTIKPRAPLLNKIEKDWLRSIFSGGFPKLGVSGTLQDPKFDQDRLRNGLIERFFRFLSPSPSSGE